MAETDADRKFQKELNSGLSGLVALALIVRSGRAMYGYEIAMELAGISAEGLPMHQGALYPVLRSLERSELLTSYVQPSTSGPPRKYYSPTDLGTQVLAQWKQSWQRTRNIVDAVVEKDHVRRAHSSRRSPQIS